MHPAEKDRCTTTLSHRFSENCTILHHNVRAPLHISPILYIGRTLIILRLLIPRICIVCWIIGWLITTEKNLRVLWHCILGCRVFQHYSLLSYCFQHDHIYWFSSEQVWVETPLTYPLKLSFTQKELDDIQVCPNNHNYSHSCKQCYLQGTYIEFIIFSLHAAGSKGGCWISRGG